MRANIVCVCFITAVFINLISAKEHENVEGQYYTYMNGKRQNISLVQDNQSFIIYGIKKKSFSNLGLKKQKVIIEALESGLYVDEVKYDNEHMGKSFKENENIEYYSNKYSDGSDEFYIIPDVIVKVKDDLARDKFARIIGQLNCEVTRGKFSDKEWSISNYSNLKINAKSSNEVLRILRELYKIKEFESIELPRTYSIEHDGVDLSCSGTTTNVDDPLLIDNATDLNHTPNRSYANVFQAWCHNRGARIRIGILDNGFNVGHTELIGQIADSFNVATASHSDLAYYSNGSYNNSYTNHGTTITGLLVGIADNANLAAGIAPDARAYVCRITDNSSATQWIDALQYFIDYNVHVVSSSIRLSIGATVDRSSAADQQFYELIHSNDIVWCQSTSNCEDDCSVAEIGTHRYPVELQSVNETDFGNAFFNVAGLHTTVADASFEPLQKRLGARGPEINISYPAIQNLVYNTGDYTAYDHALGTSWATPSVAGIVALVRAQIIRELGGAGSLEDVIRIIETSAMREPTYEARDVDGNNLDFINNYNETYGFGIPDANAAVEQAISEYHGRNLTAILQLLLLD
jgi:subtilisin family serine protease